MPSDATESNAGLQIYEIDFIGNMTLCFEHFYDSSKKLDPPKFELDMTEFGVFQEQAQGEKLVINWKEWIWSIEGGRTKLAAI
ncbi:hypothetical protein AJ80_08712 [Polytolypa hystricis UAMH7299]|uniref:Uncharacterized protein n=1 Tax=Polytolypa hystricis (strain UAMH7299) TaxID=1447883 RepID=A0A2B7X3A2_POLH7|nr:hypothetical protein AJ80_08712 [Polytolypa hystricis UAMH7299]